MAHARRIRALLPSHLVLAFLLVHPGIPGRALGETALRPAISPAVDAIKLSLQKGDFDTAISVGEKAVAESPGDALLQLWLGRAYGSKAGAASLFSRMSLAKKCRAAFEKAVTLDPTNVDAHFALLDYHLQAPGIAGGDKDVARKQADEILRLDPTRGHLAWGRVWEEAKDQARAEAEYRKAIEAGPKEIRGRIALASLLVTSKRVPEAREIWLQFAKTEPDQSYWHYALARISVATGEDLTGGVEHLRAYLAVPPRPDTPTWADAHWRLSNLYEKMDRRDEAKAELREALKLNPDHAPARKDLKRLEN
ncbi:MAG: tetratricopeptide repeat protein [Thermoanaerobaculia bacterium]|nr:tetratricopeptide repeat protein [Thermoanaerobaculia bacterium]